jgi:hypothetical protein
MAIKLIGRGVEVEVYFKATLQNTPDRESNPRPPV